MLSPDGSWLVEAKAEDAAGLDPYLQDRDGRFSENDSDFKLPSVIGILPIRNAVAYPGTVTPPAVGRKRSRALLADAEPRGSIIGLLTQRNTETETPNFDDLYSVGTAASVIKVTKLPQGPMHVLVHGMARFKVIERIATKPYLRARIRQLNVKVRMTKKIRALIVSVCQAANRVIELSPNVPDDASVLLENIENPSSLADFLAANLSLAITQKQQLLEELDAVKRLEQISVVLAHQLEVLEFSHKIQGRVRESVDKSQREYFLQEQLKAIQSELGQKDFHTEELKQIGENIGKRGMPEAVEQEESASMPGKGRLQLTGQIGEVMKESAQAAFSIVKANAGKLEIDPERFTNHDFHIHVPAGAIPKDGPSAGVATFTSLVSLLLGRPTHPDVAMTGEITLRGLVLPVGGLKEKILAARQAGIKTVILPARNKKDIPEVPKEAKKGLEFKFIKRTGEVLKLAISDR